jgi:hypothetical protein
MLWRSRRRRFAESRPRGLALTIQQLAAFTTFQRRHVAACATCSSGESRPETPLGGAGEEHAHLSHAWASSQGGSAERRLASRGALGQSPPGGCGPLPLAAL